MAKEIKTQFPQAYEVDCETPRFDMTKVGTYSKAEIWIPCSVPEFLGWIVNGYTQFSWKGPGAIVDYGAVRSIFKTLRAEMNAKGWDSPRYGIPMIGSKRGGGDWNQIQAIIAEEMTGCDITVVEFDGVDNWKRWR